MYFYKLNDDYKIAKITWKMTLFCLEILCISFW